MAAMNLLVLLPAGVNILDSTAIEDVLMLRDEPSEMAWGVERTVVGASGKPTDRALAWRTTQPAIPPPSANAIAAYRLGSTVPDYWIPFLPVATDTGPLQLRRGRLPTASGGPASCSPIQIRQCSSRSSHAREFAWPGAFATLGVSMVQHMSGSDGSDRPAVAKVAVGCALITWISPGRSLHCSPGQTPRRPASYMPNIFARTFIRCRRRASAAIRASRLLIASRI